MAKQRPLLTVGIEEEYQIVDPENARTEVLHHPISG